MPWIETVPYDQAEGRLKQLYDRIKGPGDNIDNIMKRPRLPPPPRRSRNPRQCPQQHL